MKLNKKFSEIALEVGGSHYPDVGGELLQKFGEAVVRECASLTLDYAGPDHYAGWLDYRDEIKKHFGVKE